MDGFKERIISKLQTDQRKEVADATGKDMYYVIASIVNEEILPHWQLTQKKYIEKSCKQVYYLSMEFLVGSLLESNLLNCGMLEQSNQALKQLGFDPDNYICPRT